MQNFILLIAGFLIISFVNHAFVSKSHHQAQCYLFSKSQPLVLLIKSIFNFNVLVFIVIVINYLLY